VTNIRRQLTLFVKPSEAQAIEKIREEFNPRQFELIKPHVTLCREDEIQNLEQVIANLRSLKHDKVIIQFGRVTRSADGKGVFLPATTESRGFQKLRNKVLKGLTKNLNAHEPHITLMHPRNSTCTDSIFDQIERISFPTQLVFERISLIEQEDGGRWTILQEYDLQKEE
jgi:2'-5' RNA ligase